MDKNSRDTLEDTYRADKSRLVARLRAAGRTLEDAEDIVHDVYAETMSRISLFDGIRNLPAWINTLLTRRIIDAWRHDRVREASGEVNLAEDTLREIMVGAGLDPIEEFVRENLVDALNDAIAALPASQRWVIEMQMFRGLKFRELSDMSGESIDTLTARKRYALQSLSGALRYWTEQ